MDYLFLFFCSIYIVDSILLCLKINLFMLYSEIKCIQSKMNEYGRLKKSFLFAVNFELTEGFIIEDPLSQSEVLFEVNGIGNILPTESSSGDVSRFEYKTIPYNDYKKKFDIVYDGLKEGNSYLTNLTVKTEVSSDLLLDDIIRRSSAPYKLYVPDRFICFSPERFVCIKGQKISTNPMKGTIDASVPDAENKILNDFKETAEHNTIVDLLRNDLSMFASNVRVEKYRYIDHIKTNKQDILQVSSEISGTLHYPYVERLGDVIMGMLPAGSVSGAPKEETVRIIEKAENEPRGFYTGVFGYYDGEVLDTAVLIRYIEKEVDKYYFRSGGGITAYSDCLREYEEVIEKVYLPI